MVDQPFHHLVEGGDGFLEISLRRLRLVGYRNKLALERERRTKISVHNHVNVHIGLLYPVGALSQTQRQP